MRSLTPIWSETWLLTATKIGGEQHVRAEVPHRRSARLDGVGAAVSIYVLAVFFRTSLAVAGLTAAERFDISAAQLATFTMVQLLVYAGMQLPVGVLIDRLRIQADARDRADVDDDRSARLRLC